MATAPLQFFKETALPAVVNPHSIYFVAPPSDPAHVEIYVTNSTGAVTRKVVDSADVQNMINTSIAAANTLTIVADIAARDALAPTHSIFAFVTNATGDSTVVSGGATYLWNPTSSAWIKVSEAESLDVVLQWANIQGKPTSSPSQIDTAVANTHTHANKTQLDKVGENGAGLMTYNGSLVSGWNTTSW
jgi:hypothetical protein